LQPIIEEYKAGSAEILTIEEAADLGKYSSSEITTQPRNYYGGRIQ
jgi:hypothetical protein